MNTPESQPQNQGNQGNLESPNSSDDLTIIDIRTGIDGKTKLIDGGSIPASGSKIVEKLQVLAKDPVRDDYSPIIQLRRILRRQQLLAAAKKNKDNK